MSTKEFIKTSFLDRLEFAVNDKLDGNWAELSRKSGLGASTIHQIKTGADPKASSLQRISHALNVSLDWLVNGEGSMSKEPSRIIMDEKRLEKMAELLIGLNEDQQREIFTIAEEKKRLNNLELTVQQFLRAG